MEIYICLSVKTSKKRVHNQSASLNELNQARNLNQCQSLTFLMNYSNNQLVNQSVGCSIIDSKLIVLMPEKSCIFTKVVDHGIKTDPFKTELSCGVFIVFSHLFNAYLTVYVLNPTSKTKKTKTFAIFFL